MFNCVFLPAADTIRQAVRQKRARTVRISKQPPNDTVLGQKKVHASKASRVVPVASHIQDGPLLKKGTRKKSAVPLSVSPTIYKKGRRRAAKTEAERKIKLTAVPYFIDSDADTDTDARPRKKTKPAADAKVTVSDMKFQREVLAFSDESSLTELTDSSEPESEDEIDVIDRRTRPCGAHIQACAAPPLLPQTEDLSPLPAVSNICEGSIVDSSLIKLPNNPEVESEDDTPLSLAVHAKRGSQPTVTDVVVADSEEEVPLRLTVQKMREQRSSEVGLTGCYVSRDKSQVCAIPQQILGAEDLSMLPPISSTRGGSTYGFLKAPLVKRKCKTKKAQGNDLRDSYGSRGVTGPTVREQLVYSVGIGCVNLLLGRTSVLLT